MARKSKDETVDETAVAPIGKAIKLTVSAKSPMWRGPVGWDKYWQAGETIVPAEELADRAPELVEEMIARLDEDPNFSVSVERETVEG